MKKSLLCALALSIASFASMADAAECVVELKNSAAQVITVFRAAECREALRDCSKAARDHSGSVCEQVREPQPQPQPQPQAQGPIEIRHLTLSQQLQSRVFQNCELRQASMYDHELLVDQVFFGRFDLYRDQVDLDRVVSNLVRRGDCRYKRADILSIQLDPRLIQESMSGMNGCRLAEEIFPQGRTGRYRLDIQYPRSSQVFLLPAQEAELREALAISIINRHCSKGLAREQILLRDPMLVQDFINQGAQFCHLRSPNGITHTLYIRGRASGQFDLRRDEAYLRDVLVRHIMQGTCVLKRPRF